MNIHQFQYYFFLNSEVKGELNYIPLLEFALFLIFSLVQSNYILTKNNETLTTCTAINPRKKIINLSRGLHIRTAKELPHATHHFPK